MAHAACKPHFLLLPLPEQGHITPMLSLASRLTAMGCTVTFLKAEKAPLEEANQDAEKHAHDPSENADNHLHELPENADQAAMAQEGPIPATLGTDAVQFPLRFRTLQRVLGGVSSQPIGRASSLFDIMKHTVAGLEERQGMVENMVEESKGSEAPITCIVCDFLLCHWVVRVAKRQAILAAVLVPYAAINFFVPYLSKIGKWEEGQELYRHVGLMEPMDTNVNVSRSEVQRKRGSEMLSWLMRQYEGVEEASHILVNSYRHLEYSTAKCIDTCASKLKVQYIGPCLPAWEDGDATSTMGDIAKQAGCLHTEELACLTWLDKREKGSVLLVSFGSEAILEAEQVEELAMGIEASGWGYLWVVRAGAPSHNLPPEDFRERTRDMGMCVPWVPQRKVLQHDATGGFLTHCGWNSAMESIAYGVPMLCFPMNADQFLNAHLIYKHWKVGVPLEGGCAIYKHWKVVSRVEVERALRTLLGSHDLHQRVVQFQQAAQCALLESHKSLASFVQDIAANTKFHN